MSHGPIESDQRKMMNAIAETLDTLFNPEREKKIAFVLLTAKIGDIQEGRVNYISNANRDDMVATMRELLARFEGAYDAPSTTTKQ